MTRVDAQHSDPLALTREQEAILAKRYVVYAKALESLRNAERVLDELCTVLAGHGYHLELDSEGTPILRRAEVEPSEESD